MQDIYAALCCDAEVVVFQNHTECHKGFLTVVANLITKGESPLAGRYVLQNGRLIDAGTALVPDAVASLSARSKYLVLFTELAPPRALPIRSARRCWPRWRMCARRAPRPRRCARLPK